MGATASYADGHWTVSGGDWTQQTAKTVYDSSHSPLATDHYSYNLQGRMSQVDVDSDGNGDLEERYEFTYDASGIRVSQTVTKDSDNDGSLADETPVETKYLNDANNPTGYSQVLEEKQDLDHDGALAASEVTRSYTLGLDVAVQADASGNVYSLLKDGHGSTRALANTSGQIVAGQVYAYDAFGNAIGFDPANALTSYLYCAEARDSTGLVYLRERYYNAMIARFTTLDSFAGNSQDPLSLHKYLFCHGDGINFTDPTGQFEGGLTGMLGSMGIRTNLASLEADVGNQLIYSTERGEYAWDIVAWNVGIYASIYVGLPLVGMAFSGLWQALPKIPGVVRAAEYIGKGGSKIVYAVSGFVDRVVAVLKPGKLLTVLEEEIGSLIRLERAGLPIPKIYGITEIEGQAAYVMERFAQGSKEVVKTVGKNVEVVGPKGNLNARSVQDLKQIRQIMLDRKIWVNDLQFLIGEDGRIALADPIACTIGETGPSRINLKIIQKLIEVASGK